MEYLKNGDVYLVKIGNEGYNQRESHVIYFCIEFSYFKFIICFPFSMC